MTGTTRLVGYARVSTADQNTDLQINALRGAGCAAIFEDKITGIAHAREGLDLALASIGQGEKLVVWKLDRLGRSIPHVMTVIADLEKRGASLVSLTENFDTSTEAGEIYSTILALFAHVERRMISQRTRAGLRAAKERGVVLGRRRKLSPSQIAEARNLMASGDMKAEAVAERYGVARATLFRNLKRQVPARLAA
ncbi:putative recombinase [Caenibius tardaugens NBRC 16725]|uniref:Putative recombinase n=1 Tax=Caenibius tardaugens NBRC 16725 TaxID=1219035 RepID=U2YBT9_9SPHN|nr:recombinase family protein [Caenibius tardaugens]AZI37876.1 recombinase family protein [Caenibius tardaugens NBRC 16725]GAD50996.1 putative recombinase [Caenibius tardaugens NBRC 16725]